MVILHLGDSSNGKQILEKGYENAKVFGKQ